MSVCRYQRTHTIRAPLEAVWAFFEREDAFELLNPPWSKARLVQKTGGLEAGAEVHLNLPMGIVWIVRHTGYEKFCYFIDSQVRGPFRCWTHIHRFKRKGGQTDLIEEITFSLPLPWLSNFLFGWLVKKQLDRLFLYRKSVISNYLENK